MADYTVQTDSQLDPDAPLTSELAYGWRDNCIAISEGSVGAPVVRAGWHPYNMGNIGDGGTGLIYNGASSSTITTPDFVDGYEYRLIFVGLRADTNNTSVQAWMETTGGYTPVSLYHDGEIGRIWGHWDVHNPRSVSNVFYISQNTIRLLSVSGNGTIPDLTPKFMQVFDGTAQKILRLRLTAVSGVFNVGQVFLHRRLAL